MIVPYDCVRRIQLNQSTEFYLADKTPETAFDKNPFNDDFELRVTLEPTCDTWYTTWNFIDLKLALKILNENQPKDMSFDYKTMLIRLQDLIDKVEHIRTMHVMKQWGLDKFEGQDGVIDLAQLLADIDAIKTHYT